MPAANPVPPHRCQCILPPHPLPELNMAFQPIVNVQTGRTLGYEALVRGPQGEDAAWVFAQILPSQKYALDQACRALAIHTAAQLNLSGRLSINFLPGAVYEPHACIQPTLRAARDTAFPLRRLMFEVVEQENVADPEHVRRILDAYRAYGFMTALDDYGAGHATPALLMALRPDVVKLDRSLVRDVHLSPGSALRVRDMVRFARQSSLHVIAEGIETVHEARALLELGVTFMQGYYFARPAMGSLPTVPHEAILACRS
ncbi:EAL domain-containing protein [Deinococcus depolymerans]|uniref:EAL domain-containing protein n=1 Tax=Deinococcus depolymerans TaxID=392408 RepID=A0ABN1BNT7_9DEIO